MFPCFVLIFWLDCFPSKVDLTLNGGSSTKSSARSYPSTSRLTPSAKRQNITTSQPAEIRTQNPLPVVSAGSGNSAAINFFSLPSSRDALCIMAASDPLVAGGASRHGASADFSRQPVSEDLFLEAGQLLSELATVCRFAEVTMRLQKVQNLCE